MKRLILAVTVLTMCCISIYGQQQQGIETYINVTGKSEREIVPNEIYINITIDEADNNKITVAEQQRKMIAALKGIGIDVEKNLQVNNLSSDLKTYVLRKNQVQTSKSYTLKVDSATQAAEVFQKLSTLSISDMEIGKVTHSDLGSIKMEMRTEAMKNAQQIAQTLAEAVGQTAGKAFMINDYNFDNDGVVYKNQPLMMRSMAAYDTAEAEAEPTLEFKDLNLSYSVNVKFYLY